MKTDGNIVVLEFDLPTIPVDNNPFKALSDLAEKNKIEKDRVETINLAVKNKHAEILEECITTLFRKMMQAKIGGIEIDRTDVVLVDTINSSAYCYIKLAKQGVGNKSHIKLHDAIKIQICNEAIRDGGVMSENYYFTLQSSKTIATTRFNRYETMQRLMLESVEHFINNVK